MTLYSVLSETVKSQRSNLFTFLLSHCLTKAHLSLNLSINLTSLSNASGKPSYAMQLVRQTFMECSFPKARHVVMDEVHNYEKPNPRES